ncbi:MAG: ABC transporter ATP-binding protein [Lentisphaerae bacterium]|nr:ABC transporter ATP-binding protein [Lentisphaerota bacterium]
MIDIINLTKTFGRFTAVDDLSLHVPKGELFCFLGPNGAGKTTTIKVLTGLLHPTAGRTLIDGVDIQQDPLSVKKRIGYVPDMPFLYERLTTAEFFEFTGDLYDTPRETIRVEMERLFGLFGLDGHRAALVKDLSHGMKQRLIYSTTFLHNPDVLFIDEPLVGLDPHTIRLIKDLLVAKTREGMTIFLTTHILALAEDIADRIGIITGGKLLALGSRDDLTARTGTRNLEEAFLQLTE